MKKVLTICMAVLMLASLTLTVLAAPNGFASSPSGNKAPEVKEFTPADEDCTATLVITPYAEKEKLSESQRKLLETAYTSITDAEDLTDLHAGLKKAAGEKKINSKNLAVSDLFDIHPTDCDYHEGHKDFDIALSAQTLESFVGLLHMNQSGKWDWVEDAHVSADGTHLKFSVEGFSPFAIVVDTATQEAPLTGDDVMLYVWLTSAAAVAFAACMVAFVISNKKNKAN